MSAFVEIARHQVRVALTRPMNIATGIVSPLLFMTLLTAPRLSRMTPEQTTAVFTGSLLASLWAASLWSGAGILRRERRSGTLAPSFTAWPTPLTVLLGKTVGGVLYDAGLIMVTQAIFCLVTRMRLGIADPVAFVLGLFAVVACGVASSLLVGACLMLSRHAFQLTTALGTPIMLIGGTLIPPSELPQWISWLCYIVNLSWLQSFLASTATRARWMDLLVGLVISVVYAWLGARAVTLMLNRARKDGTLDLT